MGCVAFADYKPTALSPCLIPHLFWPIHSRSRPPPRAPRSATHSGRSRIDRTVSTIPTGWPDRGLGAGTARARGGALADRSQEAGPGENRAGGTHGAEGGRAGAGGAAGIDAGAPPGLAGGLSGLKCTGRGSRGAEAGEAGFRRPGGRSAGVQDA